MNILDLSERAKGFYEDVRPANLVSGFEKYILTDGDRCTFLKTVNEQKLEKGQEIFYCRTSNGVTLIEEL